MPADTVSGPRLKALFTEEERAFLKDFFVRHSNVGDNFIRFLDMPPPQRPDAALAAIKGMPRKGWVIRGIKEHESVYEHIAELSMLLDMSLVPLLNQGGYPAEEAGHLSQRIRAMAKLHDMHEALATDFTPSCNISEQDKHKVELLAAKVIFEKFPEDYALAKEYIRQQTMASHLLHDFDKIHAVVKAAAIEVRNPQQRESGLFRDFLSHASSKMKTKIGRQYLDDVAAEQAQLKQQ